MLEQVRSQIEVLNRDYRAANPDVDIVPPVFRDLVADSRVEFGLATTGPDGQPTDGITRTRTDAVSFDTDDRVKSSATGGADPGPRTVTSTSGCARSGAACSVMPSSPAGRPRPTAW